MKERFANFMVAKSRVILVIFIILALACAALIPLVNVNRDMTEYLAKDSDMRHGLDLMKAEFGNEESSTLEIMFSDLRSDRERKDVFARLQKLPLVESVDYELPASDEDQEYNRGQYTRYIINCEHGQYSDEAAELWASVRDLWEDEHDISLGGPINDANESGLPLWIIIAAVALIVLILLAMANSWIEPVAFLITIGVAVLINMGTYVLFPSISSTTFSIVALLQMVLSMDYSIMLLNRYRQQRQLTADKREAMRNALTLSFGAITGSSLTTFAGLLALLFMSFTIGADVGLALAKGVIVSLICIFTVLPALLLGFDSLMMRTSKRTIPFDLPRFSRFQFRMRVPLTILFALLFTVSFIGRSGSDFSYAQVRDSAIDSVFGHTNTIVMIYNEKDGTSAGSLADALDRRSDIHSAVCYESTLGKQRDAVGMKDFLEEMKDSEDAGNADMDLSESMLRLIYYDYHAGDPQFRMTVPTFVNYLRGDVMNDPDFGDSIDSDARSRVDDMVKFTDAGALTTARSAAGLADFFDMRTSQAKQLLLYYQIKRGKKDAGKMTLPGFIRFLIRDVADDPQYGSMIDANAKKKLKSMQIYTDKEKMTSPAAYPAAAQILGMDEMQARSVYLTHYAKAGVSSVMTIADLSATLEMMSSDPVMQEQFGGEETAQLIAGLAQIGQMDPSEYDIAAMAQALPGYGIPLDAQTLTMVYAFRDLTSSPESHLMSVQDLVSFMLSDETISASLPEKQKNQLDTLKKIIGTSVRGTRLSASSMGRLLGMKKSDVRSVYLLHAYKTGHTGSWKLSPQQFVAFLNDHVLNDPDLRSKVGDSAGDLKAARRLIDSVVASREFTYTQLADLLDDFSDSAAGLDAEDLCLLYELYGSEHSYDEAWTMNLMQMVSHLDDSMTQRPAFASAMDEKQTEDLHETRADLDEAAQKLEGEHYGRMMISARMQEDSDQSRDFIKKLTASTDQHFSHKSYLIGNTPMAYEMSLTFRSELNKITLLTAAFILFIVLMTFRRLATSVILVLIIQCAVFLTMCVLNLLNIEMNYLALLIVQSIMMGATIDYAIIYSTYYTENRGALAPADAIRASCRGSLQTILTSATILTAAVGLLSFAFSEPATRQICRILSIGCLIATLLVIFILPAVLACLDRLVVKRTSSDGVSAERAD